MNYKIQLIADTYGIEAQTEQTKEEISELAAQLEDNNSIMGIAEEIADVEIMLEQMKYLLDIDALVEKYKGYKIDRTVKIIKGECKVAKAERPSYCGKIPNACEICEKTRE